MEKKSNKQVLNQFKDFVDFFLVGFYIDYNRISSEIEEGLLDGWKYSNMITI